MKKGRKRILALGVLCIIFSVIISFSFANIALAVNQRVAAGDAHTVAIKSDGSLWEWGTVIFRDGFITGETITHNPIPVRVGSDSNWVTVAAGYDHTVAIKSDGTLWAWGFNDKGQLGDGTTTKSKTPVRIGTDSNWSSVEAGKDYTVAIKTDGSLWAWGINGSGQLGDGTFTERHAPVRIGNGGGWVSVAAGTAHTVAIKSDGSLWTWGNNSSGQLGDGMTTNRNKPVISIGLDKNWASVAAGAAHTAAIKSDGSLWTWGDNSKGQLGDGTYDDGSGGYYFPDTGSGSGNPLSGYTSAASSEPGATTKRLKPYRVGTDSNWSSVAAGGSHTLAIKSDGTLWAWGQSASGQTGNGILNGGITGYAPTCLTTPTRVGSDSNWVGSYIAGGSDHTVAIKSDGSLWVCGSNVGLQLGDGTIKDSGYLIAVNISSTQTPSTQTPASPTTSSQNLKAKVVSNGVLLEWNPEPNTNGLVGYNLYQGTTPGGESSTPLTDFAITETSYTDETVDDGVTYYYIMKPVYNDNSLGTASNEVSIKYSQKSTIVLKIGNPKMMVNGVEEEIDPGKSTAPVIVSGRTFLPIKAIAEAMGGTVGWTGKEKKVTVTLNNTKIDLWISKKDIKVNGVNKPAMNVAPFISKTKRTMLPLRFVAENLGCTVDWNAQTKSATITFGGVLADKGNRLRAIID